MVAKAFRLILVFFLIFTLTLAQDDFKEYCGTNDECISFYNSQLEKALLIFNETYQNGCFSEIFDNKDDYKIELENYILLRNAINKNLRLLVIYLCASLLDNDLICFSSETLLIQNPSLRDELNQSIYQKTTLNSLHTLVNEDIFWKECKRSYTLIQRRPCTFIIGEHSPIQPISKGIMATFSLSSASVMRVSFETYAKEKKGLCIPNIDAQTLLQFFRKNKLHYFNPVESFDCGLSKLNVSLIAAGKKQLVYYIDQCKTVFFPTVSVTPTKKPQRKRIKKCKADKLCDYSCLKDPDCRYVSKESLKNPFLSLSKNESENKPVKEKNINTSKRLNYYYSIVALALFCAFVYILYMPQQNSDDEEIEPIYDSYYGSMVMMEGDLFDRKKK